MRTLKHGRLLMDACLSKFDAFTQCDGLSVQRSSEESLPPGRGRQAYCQPYGESHDGTGGVSKAGLSM